MAFFVARKRFLRRGRRQHFLSKASSNMSKCQQSTATLYADLVSTCLVLCWQLQDCFFGSPARDPPVSLRTLGLNSVSTCWLSRICPESRKRLKNRSGLGAPPVRGSTLSSASCCASWFLVCSAAAEQSRAPSRTARRHFRRGLSRIKHPEITGAHSNQSVFSFLICLSVEFSRILPATTSTTKLDQIYKTFFFHNETV